MADILPGYSFDSRVGRYRDTARGQFVARSRIVRLLDVQIHSVEQRLGNIVSAMADKSLSPGVGQTLMRDELRRLSLQNAALGKGGFDKLDFRDYGRVGRQLRENYPRVANLAQGLANGTVTLDQAMNRIRGYAGDARVLFFETERETLRATGRTFEQRRRLNPAEHCQDCVRYASMSWRPMGELPPPGMDSRCNRFCRCTMETREVTPDMVRQRQAARLERMLVR